MHSIIELCQIYLSVYYHYPILPDNFEDDDGDFDRWDPPKWETTVRICMTGH